MYVIKFDGRKEEFQKEKIIRTCLRMHATQEQANSVAKRVESKAYDGIPTREILKLIFTYLKEFKPEIAYHIDLRESISLLRPKPDFEKFVQLLLGELGFEIVPNQLVRGKCVEHEIDAIARKEGKTIFVEIKHHLNSHTYTGVDVCLETFARLQDLKEGFDLGLNSINFEKALIVCNTKFSEHAKQYAKCKGIELLGWHFPEESGLEQIIIQKNFYPISFLKDLDSESKQKLADSGIVLLKQIVETDLDELYKKTEIPKTKLRDLIEKAKKILKVAL